MKKSFRNVFLIATLFLTAPVITSQAQTTSQSPQVEETTSILNAKEKEFKFFSEEEGSIERSDYPIRIRVENIQGDQADLRFIWHREDRSVDEVFPVTIISSQNEHVPLAPDGTFAHIKYT